MSEFNTEKKQIVPIRQTVNNIPLESKAQLLFLGLLSLSFIGYFVMRQHWMGFIFGHLAALSIMGFYGCFAGVIAKKKGYSYSKAFQIGFFLPIILGGISAFLLAPFADNRSLPLTCGGWISLAVGLIVVVSYLFVKKRIPVS